MARRATTHYPVLWQEVLELLAPSAGARYLDCTFGGGGHTQKLLEASSDVVVVAIDRDPAAKERAEGLVKTFGVPFKFYDISFGDLDKIEEKDFSGILFDLGVSSFQLEAGDRGFSFQVEGKLDMRMDPRKGMPASEFLEKASYKELVEAIRNYGEERVWKRIVNAIMGARGTGVLESSTQFAELVRNAVGRQSIKRGRIDAATKTFQGIRIAVNGELKEIERALPVAFEKLTLGGLLIVISFHSLEDRFVKRFFRRMAGEPEHRGDSLPKDLRKRYGKLVTRRPIKPSEEEIAINSRSRSARLRAIRKEKEI